MKYFSYVGSFDGGIKIKGRWVGVKNLNYINKSSWERHQGELTPAMQKAGYGKLIDARALLPALLILHLNGK